MVVKSKVRKWGKWEAKENSFARGGQGLVYRVRDTSCVNSDIFVLKELLNPKRNERFSNEIKAITLLSKHAHVIDIIDYGAYKDPDKPTYVMPEADNNLESYINDEAVKLSVIECLSLFQKIVSGVEHLHNSRIIHRDIKPDNVLMFSGEPKISDFGLCLIGDMPRVTETQEAVGPRYYMAPELEDGFFLDVDFKADIYSLGKILYFLLSGGKVFSREKYKLRHWSLSEIKGDCRYKIFDLVFQRTIVENRHQRLTCNELINEISEVREKYLNHPITTLENKIPQVHTSFDGTIQQLSTLDEPEWNELLKIRKINNSKHSESIISVAFDAITEKTAESFLYEINRCCEEINREKMSALASKLIMFHSGMTFLDEAAYRNLIYLAVEHEGAMGVNAAAKIFNLKDPKILSEIALRVDELESESLEHLLMLSASCSYPNRINMLLWALNHEHSKISKGFIVAGLMHEGSDNAIDGVAEIFREIKSIEECPELFQGIALSSKAHSNIKKLIERGGYNDDVSYSLEILSELSDEVSDVDKK
ncbi:serine/threonine-protein kinase [Enterobacter hormaechei]|uniref:serine/threonine-protein kinase n=1 Tax=Enterobacter cloacae complex TaxID=354276 RepID=UPI001BE08DBC|nr:MULTISPECIES: serine/threonine-protein kinase [Enterobacter cloacae complex]MBT2044124.1 serine/threonine protein kinase [Enterobacter hormaechei subsp. xiangfangensis]MBT2093683.1 serine/threonine protein kinase [Enterobacter hormaechei subsp. xiangfangensis]MCE1262233.1 serine/threonine protein kinase [Enterobacter kobei]MCE1361725.1 serine/threonine protein kinase [Enterobacter kobei]MCL8089605.1 serine/threonine protein kinase [Enterobacter hormaechei]